MKSATEDFSGLRVTTSIDAQNIPSRPRRGVTCVQICSNHVYVRGEALSDVWWRGKQWAVTAYGIECLDGTYTVDASRLTESLDYQWPLHMAAKTWVDVDEFTTAWMVALLLHGKAGEIDAGATREMFGKLRPTQT